MNAELHITGPLGQSRVVPLHEGPVSLGRLETNQLAFPEDAGLSRHHLILERQGSHWTLRDLGSTNGTYVNAARISTPHVLRTGDRIVAGHLTLDYQAATTVTLAPQRVQFEDPGQVQSPSTTSLVSDLHRALGRRTESMATASTTPPGDARTIELLIRAGQELGSLRPLAELFPVVLDLALEAVEATRGVLLTLDEKGELAVAAAKGDAFRISSSVRDRVLHERASLLVRDAQFDAHLRASQTIARWGVRSMMAVPLQTSDRVTGLLYVDTPRVPRPFTEQELNLLTVMANVAAIRLEQARLTEIAIAERALMLELAQAADIQRRLLPEAAPRLPGFEILGHNLPCGSVGGDYFDFLPWPDGRMGLVVGDVAGKGMPAALMMTSLQARVQTLAESCAHPAALMTALNRTIVRRSPANSFISLFLGVLDPQTGQLVYCNAGHNPPLLSRRDGTVERLEGGGLVLGVHAGAEYCEWAVTLAPNDLLALYSDGVTETCTPTGDRDFGEEHLARVLQARHHEPVSAIVQEVLRELSSWCGGGPFTDDVTLVVLRRLATAAAW